MEASELRIGNLIMKDGDEIIVSHHTFYHLEIYGEDYEPIPLTEEWLEKSGFKSTVEWLLKYKNNSTLLVSDVKYGFQNIPIQKIKYVHQLQNLYFALTGEELTIK